MAIQSFSDRETEDFFYSGLRPKKADWSYLSRIVQRKLDILHFSRSLSDLRSPPGNRLEALKGTLSGFYSIRINKQWRIIFRWSESGPTDVQVCDYH